MHVRDTKSTKKVKTVLKVEEKGVAWGGVYEKEAAAMTTHDKNR